MPAENNQSENSDNPFEDSFSQASGVEDPQLSPGNDSPKVQQKKSAETTYLCTQCDAQYTTSEEIKFCSKCGAPVNPAQASASSMPKRALLVDDSQMSRKKIGAILKKLGCEVIEAEDGIEGLDQARKVRPDLIILDVQMPKINGLEVLKTLRQDQQFDSTPIVIMTVDADPIVVGKALSSRANDYIRKDTSVADILTRLRRHV